MVDLRLFEELLPERKEILRSGNERQVPCRNLTNSSLDPALKGQDCAELPVQQLPLDQIPEDLSQQQFDKIASFVEKEDLETAVEMIHPLLQEGNLDIRLIVYYFYAHFLKEGVKSFSSTLPLLASLLDTHWKLLKPTNRKARQIENSLSWFFSHLLSKLKYGEKLAAEGRDYPLWQKSVALSDREFREVLMSAQQFHQFFYEKWEQSPTKERVTHLLKKIDDLHPLIFSEKKQEGDSQAAPAVVEEKEVALPVSVEGIDVSEAMQNLILKLKLFTQLIEKKEYLKAAMVSQDLTYEIEHFDPCIYFPKLFTEYFALLATHISTLADEWQNQESLQWKSLQKLYKNDMARFSQW